MSIRALVIALTLLIVGVLGSLAVVQARLPGLTNNDRRAIHAWLICDDCRSGERAQVAFLGDAAVPVLADALVGPSTDQRKIMAAKFDTSYKLADVDNRANHLQVAQYSGLRLQNYLANYQKRAATSLGDIGGDKAKHALDEAIADSVHRQYRPDVLRVIKLARSRIDADTYAGTLKPYRVSFGDSVRVLADTTPPRFSGQSSVVIEDSLFLPSEIPHHLEGDSVITFDAIAAFGVHMITVKPGGNLPDGKLAIYVESIVDRNDRAMTSCGSTDVLCMVNNAPPTTAGQPAVFLTLSAGTPAESLDFFRITNTPPLQVTAQVDWRGDGLIDLSWVRCGTINPAGHTAHGDSTKLVRLVDQIPASQCWVLQVKLASGNGPVYGKLTLTSP